MTLQRERSKWEICRGMSLEYLSKCLKGLTREEVPGGRDCPAIEMHWHSSEGPRKPLKISVECCPVTTGGGGGVGQKKSQKEGEKQVVGERVTHSKGGMVGVLGTVPADFLRRKISRIY